MKKDSPAPRFGEREAVKNFRRNRKLHNCPWSDYTRWGVIGQGFYANFAVYPLEILLGSFQRAFSIP